MKWKKNNNLKNEMEKKKWFKKWNEKAVAQTPQQRADGRALVLHNLAFKHMSVTLPPLSPNPNSNTLTSILTLHPHSTPNPNPNPNANPNTLTSILTLTLTLLQP